MYCKKCNCEKSESEMKTSSKCLDCHRKKRAEYMRKFNAKPENREKKNNRDKINSRRKERRRNNEQERLADNLRHSVRRVIKSAGVQKTWKGEITKELTSSILLKIGPRPDDTYHLDHIIPISLFDLTKKEHRDLANSPDNLRWLPGNENLEKSDSIVLEIIKSSQELINIAKQINLI